MLLPPKPSEVEPAKVFRALLSRVPIWPIDWTCDGVDEPFFVRALSAHEWVMLHRAMERSAFGTGATKAEQTLLLRAVVDADCSPAFADASLFDNLYDHEVASLLVSAYGGLSVVSPTYASCDVDAWLDYLKEGSCAPENLGDMISLSGCHSVSFGMGKGAVHVKHEPEVYFGFPRREMLDCHWFAYRAALRAWNDATR